MMRVIVFAFRSKVVLIVVIRIVAYFEFEDLSILFFSL